MYEIGELDQRVMIQAENKTADGIGGNSSEWVDVKEVWAKARSGGGSEKEENDALMASATVTFIIRNRAITEQNRIIWNGQNYNIRKINKLGSRKLYLSIESERGVAQ